VENKIDRFIYPLLLALSLNFSLNALTKCAVANPPTPTSTKPHTERVVFFGSSSVVGVGSTRGDRRWTTLLSRYLGWLEFNEGLSGSTIAIDRQKAKFKYFPLAGIERWQKSILPRKPDRVIMLYGVNDTNLQIPLGNETNPEPFTFRRDVRGLIQGLKQNFRPDQIVVITPQPNQATLDRRAPYDRVLETNTKAVGGYFIDAGKEAFSLDELPDYSADVLHLNNLGHALFASYVANRLVDVGIAPAPPQARGGNLLSQPLVALPGNFLRVDLHQPLSFGIIHTIEAKWVDTGRARLILMRPDGRGGYTLVYRTPVFNVTAGTQKISVSRWWVLEGDRLAVWTEGKCLGGYELKPSVRATLAIPHGYSRTFPDLPPGEGRVVPQAIAVRVVD
jgi:lysophospholipase L1-like esterase